MRAGYRLGLLLAAAAFFATPASAVVELDSSFSVTDADYIGLGANYTSVGFVSGPGTAGSGVLVAPNWVLTTAHIANAQTLGVSTFTLSGNSYTITSRVIYPTYSPSPITDDIALLQLNISITGIAPAILYTGSSELTATATWVGFGQTGNGLTGQNGTGLGTRRAATNIVDVFAYSSLTPSPNIYLTTNSSLGTFLVADFDDNTLGNNTLLTYGSSPLATSLEGSLGGSDSGGGVFANFGGGPVLIGIGDFNAPGDNGSSTQYSALSGAVRVSKYASWVTAQVPEPASATLVVAGISLGTAYWLRRRR